MPTSLIIFNIINSFLKYDLFHHGINKAAKRDVIIKTGKNETKKKNNSKNELTMKLTHSLTSTLFTCMSSKTIILKAGV